MLLIHGVSTRLFVSPHSWQLSHLSSLSLYWDIYGGPRPGWSEKAMAPHSSTLAWKNPMEGGAW